MHSIKNIKPKQKDNSSKHKLFWTVILFILKITFVGFGGGNALFPIIRIEAVHKRKWLTEEQLNDVIVVTNSLPGASVIEAVSYISISVLGKLWGVIATVFGLIPHIILFFVLFVLGQLFVPSQYLSVIFVAVIPVIIALIINFVIRYIKLTKKELSYPAWISLFIVTVFFNIFIPSPFNIPAIVIVCIITFAIFFEMIRVKSAKKKNPNLMVLKPIMKQEVVFDDAFIKMFEKLDWSKKLVFLETHFVNFNQKDLDVKYKLEVSAVGFVFSTINGFRFEGENV